MPSTRCILVELGDPYEEEPSRFHPSNLSNDLIIHKICKV